MLRDKEVLMDSRRKEFLKHKQKVAAVLELYHEGELSKGAFRDATRLCTKNRNKLNSQ